MEFMSLLQDMAKSAPYAVAAVIIAVLYFRDRKDARAKAPAPQQQGGCMNHAVMIEKLDAINKGLKDFKEWIDEIFTRLRKAESAIEVLEDRSKKDGAK